MVQSLADLIIAIAEGLLYKALHHGSSVNSEVVASQMREIISHAHAAKREAANLEYTVDMTEPMTLTLGDDTDGRDSEGPGTGKADGGETGSSGPGSQKKGGGRGRS